MPQFFCQNSKPGKGDICRQLHISSSIIVVADILVGIVLYTQGDGAMPCQRWSIGPLWNWNLTCLKVVTIVDVS